MDMITWKLQTQTNKEFDFEQIRQPNSINNQITEDLHISSIVSEYVTVDILLQHVLSSWTARELWTMWAGLDGGSG